MMVAERSYFLIRKFPKEEVYGLTSQIRRAAVSVAANIAEGYGRETPGSYVQFLRISQGSLKELETHLILCQRIGMSAADETQNVLEQCDETGKMLRALIRAIQRKIQRVET